MRIRAAFASALPLRVRTSLWLARGTAFASMECMITLRTKVRVEGLSGKDVTEFLLRPNDAAYQRWWPGTHFRFHTVRGTEGRLGSVVLMDERVGNRRLRMQGVVVEAVPGKRVVWRLKTGIQLPAWLVLELAEGEGGVEITHTILAGGTGLWAAFDPLLRLYLSDDFRRSMDAHVHVEFRRLEELLHPSAGEVERARDRRLDP